MQFSGINYNLYKTFITVYETQNLSKAADLLYVSQPAVSHNVKELEKQLNIQLFYKKFNGVSATNAATVLYKYISSALNSITKGEMTISEMAGLKTGVVRIGIPTYLSVLFLSKIITEFREQYPNIKIEIISKNSRELVSLFQSQSIDVLIDSEPVVTESTAKTKTNFLKSYSHCFFSAPNQSKYTKLKVTDLRSAPIIISSISSEEVEVLKRAIKNQTINPIIESGSTESTIKLVLNGNGIGYSQREYVEDYLKNQTLKEIPTIFTLPKIDVYLNYISDPLTNAAKKFINFINETKNI